jgi:hypothetical protein
MDDTGDDRGSAPAARLSSARLQATRGVTRSGVLAALGGATAVALVGSPFARAAGSPVATAPDSTDQNTIQPAGGSIVPLTIRSAPNQGADLTQWLDTSGRAVARVQGNGVFHTRGGIDIVGETTNGDSTAQPIVVFWNNADNTVDTRKWSMGLDTSNTPENNDFFIGRVNPDRSVNDLIFLQEYDRGKVSIGLGFVPPPPAGVAITGWDNTENVPAVMVRVGVKQTGEAIRIVDANGKRTAWIAADASANFPSLVTGSIANATPGPLAISGARISSPDPAKPNGLFLNARSTNSGTDFQLRAARPKGARAVLMQITNVDASRAYLSIRQDNGFVGIGDITDMTSPLDVAGSSIRIRTPFTPASARAGGYQGQIAWDRRNLYVCTAPNTWMRAPLASW